MKTEKTEQMWHQFCSANGHAGGRYDVVAFGDSIALKNELAELVRIGRKRATAGLLRDYAGKESEIPRSGDHVIVLDGTGEPVCVYRSTDVRIGPLASVDDAFAWDEGEGDRSRDWWLQAHRDFFSRQAAIEGFEISDSIETLFERFTVLWPPSWADMDVSGEKKA